MPRRYAFGRGDVLLGGEQQRHIDGQSAEGALLDGGQTLDGSGDLDEHVGSVGLGVQRGGLGDGGLRVVGQQRGDLEGNPPVHAVAALVGRREQVSGPPQVAQGEFEEHLLVGRAGRFPGRDVAVVVGAGLDGLVEDRRVGGEPGDRVLADVVRERAGVEQAAGDVVQPQALARLVQLLRRLHGDLLVCAGHGATSRRAAPAMCSAEMPAVSSSSVGVPEPGSPCTARCATCSGGTPASPSASSTALPSPPSG